MKLTDIQTAMVCRSLSLLLHSGISLEEGLLLLTRDLGPELAPVMEALDLAMRQGRALSHAMKDTGAFPPVVAGLVRVGEETGRLEETLFYLAEFHDERTELRQQVKNALAYPAILLLLILGVLGVLLMEVMPVFDQVYASLGGGLTGVAAGLLQLGMALKAALPVLGILLGLGILGAAACRHLPGVGRFVTEALSAKFGDRGIRRKFHNALLAHAMALGLASGLQAEEALALGCELLEPVPAAADRCRRCRELYDSGLALDRALEETELLPATQSRMLALGFRGGNADQVMEDIARRLTREARQSLETAVARIEPAMVLLCSVLVGLVLLSVMLPLMNILAEIG